MEEIKKRKSTLKVKDMNFNYLSNNTSKKIKWNISDACSSEKKKTFPKDPRTPYISYDGQDDVYLKKITEINNMDETKMKLEELAIKIQNEYNSREYNNILSRLHDLLIISDDETENNKDSYDNLAKQYNHQVKRTDHNLLDPDSVSETIKNTFYNKFLGKLNK